MTGGALVALLALAACRAGHDGVSQRESVARLLADTIQLSARLQLLPAAIEARRAQLAVPGAAVAIVTADRVLFHQGFGRRDVGGNLPVTTSTRFAIGSCTKPFTALAAMLAMDRGLLSLDDSPRRFLPYFQLRDASANAQVTLRDLLSHRTGVPDNLGAGWYERYGTAERLIRAAMRSPAKGRFRHAFHYNNYLFSAGGEATAIAFGKPYTDVITREVLEPLGMRHSGLSLEQMEASGDFAYGYADSGRTRIPPTRLVWNTAIAPAANINSTADDMARWLRMLVGKGTLDGRRILSDSAYRTMLAPAVETRGSRYALGWFVESWHDLRLYSHPGGVPGYGTRCEFLPDQGLGWVVLTNVDDQVLPKFVRETIYDQLLARSR